MKSYTTIEQSKVLAEILPLESADRYYNPRPSNEIPCVGNANTALLQVPCWSLTTLLKYLSQIKPRVYTPVLFPSEGKWTLQFTEYGHGNVCEVSCDNLIDTCYEMIIKLHEQKIL